MIKITYSEAIEQQKKLTEQKAELAKEHLANATKEIFAKFPALAAFKWTQYTPHFNDGDECTFSLNDDYSLQFGDSKFAEEYKLEGDQKTLGKAIFKDVRSAFGIVEEDDYKAVFGDHCTVIADRDGFHVEEYEHD